MVAGASLALEKTKENNYKSFSVLLSLFSRPMFQHLVFQSHEIPKQLNHYKVFTLNEILQNIVIKLKVHLSNPTY